MGEKINIDADGERVIIGASPGPRGTTIVRVRQHSLDGESFYIEEFTFVDSHGWAVYREGGKRRLTDRLTLDEALRFVLQRKEG